MDRSRRRPAAALGVAAFLAAPLVVAYLVIPPLVIAPPGFVGLALASDGDPPIRALHWIAPGADPAHAIASQPTECLQLPADAAQALQVEVGRAAFRTPLLLGGQAARAGLACETCHRDGRTNPDFQFPGVSGAPGTADVTQSLFSSHRGDGIDNPRPIPDLSGPKAKLKVDQSPDSPTLPRFIHGLVVEEFDGAEPPAAVLQGLAAYVRALQPAACPGEARQPVDVRLLMSDARRALAAARAEIARGDRPTAILMLAAARARLGLIDERLVEDPDAEGKDPDRFARLRARLRAASTSLAEAQAALHGGQDPADAGFDRWLAEAGPLESELVKAEPDSLFNPSRLRIAANRHLPH